MSPTPDILTPVEAFKQAVEKKFPNLVRSGKLVWDEDNQFYEMATPNFNFIIGGYGPGFGNNTISNSYLAVIKYLCGPNTQSSLYSQQGYELSEVLDSLHYFITAFLTDFQ